jgi:hypothetical protein
MPPVEPAATALPSAARQRQAQPATRAKMASKAINKPERPVPDDIYLV